MDPAVNPLPDLAIRRVDGDRQRLDAHLEQVRQPVLQEQAVCADTAGQMRELLLHQPQRLVQLFHRQVKFYHRPFWSFVDLEIQPELRVLF